MQCKFETEFRPRYEKTGKKNLRCFPNCSEVGHITTGFCGRPISASVTIRNDIVEKYSIRGNILDKLKIWGTITKSKNQPPSPKKRISLTAEANPGHYPLDYFDSRERTKQNPTREYLNGQIIEVTKGTSDLRLLVSFNDKKISWHYSWHSSKNTCDVNHCFKIFILAYEQRNNITNISRTELGHLKSLENFYSSDFKLYSRHRVRKLRQLVQSGAFTETMIPSYDKNFLYKVKHPGERGQSVSMNNSNSTENFNNFLPTQMQTQKKARYALPDGGINNLAVPALPNIDNGIRRSSSSVIQRNNNSIIDPLNIQNPYGFISPGGDQINILLSHIKAGYNFDFLTQQQQQRNYINIQPTHNPPAQLFNSIQPPIPQEVPKSFENCYLDTKIEDQKTFSRFMLFLICFCQGRSSVPQDIADQGDIPELAKSCINGILIRCILPNEKHLQYSPQIVFSEEPPSSFLAYKVLYGLVLQNGTHDLKKNVVDLVNILEQVSEIIIKETELTSRISGLLSTWKSDPTQLKLSEASRAKLDGTISPADIDVLMHIDTLKFNSKYGRLMTLEQEAFQLCFAFIKNILNSKGKNISNYTELMSIAAEFLLPIDSDHTPTLSVRKYLSQVLTTSKQSLNTVNNEWKPMLQSLSGHFMAEATIQRIAQERELALFQVKAQISPAQNEQLVYMQGLWEFEQFNAISQKNQEKLKNIMFNIAGLSSESLFTQLLLKMFSKWQIHTVTHEFLFIQAQKKLLANPCYHFDLTGKEKRFELPLPVPFPVTNTSTKVKAWVHVVNIDDLPSIRLIFSGDIYDRKCTLSNFLSRNETLIPKNKFVLGVSIELSADFASLKVNLFGDILPVTSLLEAENMTNESCFERLLTNGNNLCEVLYRRGF